LFIGNKSSRVRKQRNRETLYPALSPKGKATFGAVEVLASVEKIFWLFYDVLSCDKRANDRLVVRSFYPWQRPSGSVLNREGIYLLQYFRQRLL